MRVFQFLTCYPQYLAYFGQRYPDAAGLKYADRIHRFLDHCYNAVHVLDPAYRNDPEFRLTVANDAVLQLQWAKEHGLATEDLTEILLAQIEEHRTEVVYSLNPIRWDSAFVRRLPGTVRATLAFLASDWGKADLRAFTLVVSNFPHFLSAWKAGGVRAAHFSPSHDPHMRTFAEQGNRPIDICFAGTYSDLHRRRNRILEKCAGMAGRYRLVFALTHPKWKPLINLPILRRFPGPTPYLPEALRSIRIDPVYGLEMYELLGKSKIVLNAAVDLADQYRGNMRCFEAMGCGACMVSDTGTYPEQFVPDVHFLTFEGCEDLASRLESILAEPERARMIGKGAAANLETAFSKSEQWKNFQKLVELS
jgi:hypothetical protein